MLCVTLMEDVILPRALSFINTLMLLLFCLTPHPPYAQTGQLLVFHFASGVAETGSKEQGQDGGEQETGHSKCTVGSCLFLRC